MEIPRPRLFSRFFNVFANQNGGGKQSKTVFLHTLSWPERTWYACGYRTDTLKITANMEDIMHLGWATIMLWLVCLVAPSLAADPMQAFPPAEAGQVRRVAHLPAKEDESLLRVELLVGKTVAVDPHNRYFFAGSITTETIAGWGYPRYTVSALGPMAGTRMAVPPDTPTVQRFVTLAGEPLLIRYNSKLPVVVYAPAEVEVRYRIWRTEATTQPIDIQ